MKLNRVIHTKIIRCIQCILKCWNIPNPIIFKFRSSSNSHVVVMVAKEKWQTRICAVICANSVVFFNFDEDETRKSTLKKVSLTSGQRIHKHFQGDMENVLLNILKGETDNEKTTSVFSPGKQSSFLGITPLKNNEIEQQERPLRVAIEGNIGAGKSTCIEYFKKFPHVETYGEPIDWWRNVDGDNLLELLYSDINKWISVFQSYVQLTRLKVQTTKPQSQNTTVQIFERSIQNNRFCFLEHAYRKGSLNSADYAVLDQWYRWIRSNVDINLDLIVYLRTSPEVVYERVKSRNRPEESGLTLQYLADLHESHEKWLMSNDERFNDIPLLVLDGNQSLSEMEKQYRIFEEKIIGNDTRGLKRAGSTDLSKAKKNLKVDL